jgi:hypothetical protein
MEFLTFRGFLLAVLLTVRQGLILNYSEDLKTRNNLRSRSLGAPHSSVQLRVVHEKWSWRRRESDTEPPRSLSSEEHGKQRAQWPEAPIIPDKNKSEHRAHGLQRTLRSGAASQLCGFFTRKDRELLAQDSGIM